MYSWRVSQQVKKFHVQYNYFTVVGKLFQQKIRWYLTFDAVYIKITGGITGELMGLTDRLVGK